MQYLLRHRTNYAEELSADTVYTPRGESITDAFEELVKSIFLKGDESKVTVNKELVAELEEGTVHKNGGDLEGLEYKDVAGEECSVPGTVGSLARRLVRVVLPSFSL